MNNNNLTRKKETRTDTKGRRKLEIILAIYVVCYTEEQQRLEKRERIEIDCVLTLSHGGDA